MIFPGKRLQRFLLFIIPIMIGIAILFFLVKNRSDPPRKQNRSNERTVRVIELAPVDVIPKTVGFGTARPVKVWQAIAEVSGKAIYVNPLLKKGQRIKKDTLLVEIDPTEYKLSVANAETRLRSIKAQVKQLIIGHFSARYKEHQIKQLVEQAREEFEPTIAAYDGMVYPVYPYRTQRD